MSNNNYTSQGKITISYRYNEATADFDIDSTEYNHDVMRDGGLTKPLEIGDTVAETMALTDALAAHCLCATGSTKAAIKLLDAIHAQCVKALEKIEDDF